MPGRRQQKKATDLLRQLLLEPSFPGREVRRVQSEVMLEIKADADDPRTVAVRRFRKQIYGKHPLGRPPQGTVDSVAAMKPRHLRAFHDQWFQPAGGYIAASGPDEPEQTLDRLERAFKGFRGKPPEHVPLPKVELGEAAFNKHVPMAREQVHVFLGHAGIRRTDPGLLQAVGHGPHPRHRAGLHVAMLPQAAR